MQNIKIINNVGKQFLLEGECVRSFIPNIGHWLISCEIASWILQWNIEVINYVYFQERFEGVYFSKKYFKGLILFKVNLVN
jgi:hypothetical protein